MLVTGRLTILTEVLTEVQASILHTPLPSAMNNRDAGEGHAEADKHIYKTMYKIVQVVVQPGCMYKACDWSVCGENREDCYRTSSTVVE